MGPEPLRLLSEAVALLRAQDPSELPGALALGEAASLLCELHVLQTLALLRLADVDKRGLYALDDAPSTAAWVQAQRLGVDRADVQLARRLDRFPLVTERLLSGRLDLPAVRRLHGALGRVAAHVDRPDGLIDGQPGEEALEGVLLDGVRLVVAEARGGFSSEHDPVLVDLTQRLGDIAAGSGAGSGSGLGSGSGSQLARLEAGFVLLAEHVEPAQLPSGLALLVDALLPARLEDRASRGHEERGLQLVKNPDGSGWRLTADLDLESGERLHTVLQSELHRDQHAPADTAAAAALRAQGVDPHDPDHTAGCAGQGPRSRRQQHHDALTTALGRYLAAGLGGTHDKAPVHLIVTVSAAALDGTPGALPARGASGQHLPVSLVRRWACGPSRLTRHTLSLPGRAIETSHTERTLKAHERRAKRTETAGHCQAAGCRRSAGQLGARMHQHHATPWATTGTTSLADTVLLCDSSHRDLHEGHKKIRLKDGRVLGPDGWATA